MSVAKSGVLHLGQQSSPHTCYIGDQPIKTVDTVIDLGVTRTADIRYQEFYADHYRNIIAKASWTAGFIRHLFRSRNLDLLWLAFQIFVQPILMFNSQLWNPMLQKDIKAIEKLQRWYTKHINKLSDIPYKRRLQKLNTLLLNNKRHLSDLVTEHRYLHKAINSSPSNVGLVCIRRNTRTAGVCVAQHHVLTKTCRQYFANRIHHEWNVLSPFITEITSLHTFKAKLHRYLFISQKS